MSYNYQVAVAVPNEADKNRLLALFLNSDAVNNNSSINWQKATTEYGAASVESMRVMYRTALKKVKDAEANGGAPPPTPAKGKGAGAKKRKAAAETEGEDAEEAPKPKATRGRKAKKATPKSDGGDGADGESAVKAEDSD